MYINCIHLQIQGVSLNKICCNYIIITGCSFGFIINCTVRSLLHESQFFHNNYLTLNELIKTRFTKKKKTFLKLMSRQFFKHLECMYLTSHKLYLL